MDFICCRAKKRHFIKLVLNAAYLDRTLNSIVKIVQNKDSEEIMVMREKSPDALEELIKRRSVGGISQEEKVHLKELRSLRKYRPCVDKDNRVQIEGRLSKSPDVVVEAKHPLVIPSKHPLTQLVVMFYHTWNQYSRAQSMLLSTRQRFWITNGNAAVNRYLLNYAVCAIEKTKPVKQLMADLPQSRITAKRKPFLDSGLDYLGPLTFVEGRSYKKSLGDSFYMPVITSNSC